MFACHADDFDCLLEIFIEKPNADCFKECGQVHNTFLKTETALVDSGAVGVTIDAFSFRRRPNTVNINIVVVVMGCALCMCMFVHVYIHSLYKCIVRETEEE